jgi:hypothetical protein
LLKINEVEAEPILEETPKPMGVPAMDKEVNNRSLGSFAKRTKATISTLSFATGPPSKVYLEAQAMQRTDNVLHVLHTGQRSN